MSKLVPAGGLVVSWYAATTTGRVSPSAADQDGFGTRHNSLLGRPQAHQWKRKGDCAEVRWSVATNTQPAEAWANAAAGTAGDRARHAEERWGVDEQPLQTAGGGEVCTSSRVVSELTGGIMDN
jgi:hypothetical protein